MHFEARVFCMRCARLAQPKKSSVWCFVLNADLCGFFPSVWDARFIFRLCLRRLCDCWFRMQATSALVFPALHRRPSSESKGVLVFFRASERAGNKYARPAESDAGKAALVVHLMRGGSMAMVCVAKAMHAAYASPGTVASVRPPSFLCSCS